MGLKNFLWTDIKCIHLGASTTSKISYNYTYYNRTNNSALYYAKEYLHANVMEFLFLKAMMKLYLCRKHIDHYSLKAIGDALGGKDHSTIINGVKKITALIKNDSNMTITIDTIEKKLGFK